LEEKIKYYLDKKFNFKNFELIFLLILKAAIFEILVLKKTPYKVVINEYLNVSKFFLLDEQKSIINAVLDKISKEIS
jgi:N utilization substance protein B